MSKRSKSRALRQSDTRRAQLERQLRELRQDVRIADEGTEQLRILCTATITHVLKEAGIMDITVPEVNARAVLEQYRMVVERVPEHQLHISIKEIEQEKDDET